MENNLTQQEVLLITGTRFLSREWCDKNPEQNSNQFTEKEKLIDACWNGILKEILPEILEQAEDGNALYVWEIKETNNILQVELGESQLPKDKYFSLEPDVFLSVQGNN